MSGTEPWATADVWRCLEGEPAQEAEPGHAWEEEGWEGVSWAGRKVCAAQDQGALGGLSFC